MSSHKPRIGVVLFQLGGPDTLEAIEPFLFNLFSDPDIIDFPFSRLGRRALAKLISTTRAKKVQHHYAVIGGGSPIRRNTEQQARALEAHLNAVNLNAVRLNARHLDAAARNTGARSQESGVSPLPTDNWQLASDFRCFVAMRYWHPFTAEAVEQVRAAECDEIVLLPLYPQFSSTTTGSSLREWQRKSKALNEWRRRFGESGVPVHLIHDFYRNELFHDAVREKIDAALARFPDPASVELVFSAHSVPQAVIERGDPYQQQVEDTVTLVMQRGRWENSYQLCYQSKVGTSRWLQPSLRATIRRLAQHGAKNICVVPISFVSDHVETLGEIDHEARALARQLGIQQFEMTAGLNDSPTFIAALADEVMKALTRTRVEEPEELIMAN